MNWNWNINAERVTVFWSFLGSRSINVVDSVPQKVFIWKGNNVIWEDLYQYLYENRIYTTYIGIKDYQIIETCNKIRCEIKQKLNLNVKTGHSN